MRLFEVREAGFELFNVSFLALAECALATRGVSAGAGRRGGGCLRGAVLLLAAALGGGEELFLFAAGAVGGGCCEGDGGVEAGGVGACGVGVVDDAGGLVEGDVELFVEVALLLEMNQYHKIRIAWEEGRRTAFMPIKSSVCGFGVGG